MQSLTHRINSSGGVIPAPTVMIVRVLLVLFLVTGLLLPSHEVMAQGPKSFRIPPVMLPDQAASSQAQAGVEAAKKKAETKRLIIDTDPGVDDALALIWLLTQKGVPLDVAGIVTVAGNTTVDNATQNVLTVLDQVKRRDIPVIMGAAKPLREKLSHTGKLIHGPDGLGFPNLQIIHNLAGLSTDANDFYCHVSNSKATTILALGPLTNLAKAIDSCASKMKTYHEIVVLGGAKFGGNQTPVTEFNVWQDPAAAELVLNSGLNVRMVLLDAFQHFTLTQDDLAALGSAPGGSPITYIFPALQYYLSVQVEDPTDPDLTKVPIPDPAAAIFALDETLGTVKQTALVKVLDKADLARGETVVGLSIPERITMIANDKELSKLADDVFENPEQPNFSLLDSATQDILSREPDNAVVVRGIATQAMRARFVNDLTAVQVSSAAANITTTGSSVDGYQIYLPMVGSR